MAEEYPGLRGLEGTLLSQKYRLVRLIGVGGMGAVYEAVNEWTERQVAVKLLLGTVSPDALARFFREARVNSRLNHPHIVTVYDLGLAEDGSYFIVQELLRGKSLEDRLLRGPLPLREALETLLPIMDALAMAHDAGVLHRDLKPANIFLKTGVNNETVPVLIDFGLSKAAEQKYGGSVTQDAIGTPGYMAPEQALNEQNIGPQVDVWAMGAVLYRALSGQQLFDGPVLSVIYKSTTSDPRPLSELVPELPASVVAIVHRALNRDRAGRYQTMRELSGALLTMPELTTQAWVQPLRERFGGSRFDDATLPVNDVIDDELASDEHVAALVAGSTLINTGQAPPNVAPITVVNSDLLPRFPSTDVRFIPKTGAKIGRPLGNPVALGRSRFVVVVVALCLIGVAAIAVLLWLKQGDRQQQGETAVEELWPRLPELCSNWAAQLATEQHDDGAFAGIPYRPPGGWSTAQDMTALENAYAACGAPPVAVLERGSRAIDQLEKPEGWTDTGTGDATTGAAWVVLATLRAAARGDEAANQRLERAIAVLKHAQRPDGAITDPLSPTGNVFQVALSTYALNQVEPASESLRTTRGRSLDWLRTTLDAELDSGSDWAQSPGVLALSLLALAKADEAQPEAARLMGRLLQRMAALSQLEAGSCRRTLNRNDRVNAFGATAEHPGTIVVLWAPWSLLASRAAERSKLPLSDEARSTARSLRGALEALTLAGLDALGEETGFVLAEWLYVVAELQQLHVAESDD